MDVYVIIMSYCTVVYHVCHLSECAPGYHGISCLMTCGNCSDGAACDHVTGQCIACDPGWLMPMCDTGLPQLIMFQML